MNKSMCICRVTCRLQLPIVTKQFSTTAKRCRDVEPEWPLLNRKPRSAGRRHDSQTVDTSINSNLQPIESPRPRRDWTTRYRNKVQDPYNLSGRKDESGRVQRKSDDGSQEMLLVSGLSSSVRASEFYRLSGADLNDWNTTIKNVQQRRNVYTLEPSGTFALQFRDKEDLKEYSSQVKKLLRPTNLDDGDNTTGQRDDPISTTDSSRPTSVTFAPDNLFDFQRRKSSSVRDWMIHIEEMVAQDGFGQRPPVVLVEIDPPEAFNARDIQRLINEDSAARSLPWRVSRPHNLYKYYNIRKKEIRDPNGVESSQDTIPLSMTSPVQWQRLIARFVLSFNDDAEARRFQRLWNQRIFAGESHRQVKITASIIDW